MGAQGLTKIGKVKLGGAKTNQQKIEIWKEKIAKNHRG